MRSRVLAGMLVLSVSCGGPAPAGSSTGQHAFRGDVIRYRLRLRDNPVDSTAAFRCYGACQSNLSPKAYLECLARCPGFEITPGGACEKYEVPPGSVCLTARKIPESNEIDPALVVVGVVGSYLIVVGAASLCASSSSQCGGALVPY